MNKTDLKKMLQVSKTLKVLYVEDNKDAREQTLKMLQNFFDDIVVAVDGVDGLEKYKENEIDLVISDISMPYMDGIEMSKKILEINDKQYIVVVTAFNEIEKMQQLIEIGVKNYIHKPIELKTFTNAIDKVVTAYLKQKEIDINIEQIKRLNHELDALVDSFDRYVIASRTDLKGVITYASEAYQKISGYSEKELIGKPHNIVRHPDMPKEAFKDMWETIKAEKLWQGEVKNLKKDGSFYWVKAFVAPYYDGDGKHIGYSAIREDITAKKEVEALNYKLCDLLDNAGQGFLAFDKDLICENGYSQECLNIFGLDDIAGLHIADLLFGDSSSDRELFLAGIENILNSNDELSKELLLSLLPSEQKIADKNIKIEYRVLKDNRFMIMLTDITETKQLEEKIKHQDKIQKMIISIVSDRNEFLQLKKEFENFLSAFPTEIDLLMRKLHTFKGVFAQKNMVYIVDAIHQLESKLNSIKDSENFSVEILLHTMYEADLQKAFDEDINIVKNVLSDDFFDGGEFLSVDLAAINELERKLVLMLKEKEIKKERVQKVIDDVRKIKYLPLKRLLTPYISHVEKVAKKLGKNIAKVEIVGDENIVIPPEYKEFTDSLVHVFNNCVDHGIEDIESRVKNGKSEFGTIKCSFEKISNTLILEISDDGRGIDIDKLSKNALNKGIITEKQFLNMSEKDKLELIFAQDLSTKKTLSTISGRGVGMGAIKEKLESIGGKLYIENSFTQGVVFKFIIPIDQNKKEYSTDIDNHLDKSNLGRELVETILKQTEKYLIESIKLDIVEIKESDKFLSLGDCAEIYFQGKFQGKYTLTLSESLKMAIGSVFIPSGFSDDEIETMHEELVCEMANIVVGLSLDKIGDIGISTPKLLKTTECIEQNSSLIKEVTTSKGKLAFKLEYK